MVWGMVDLSTLVLLQGTLPHSLVCVDACTKNWFSMVCFCEVASMRAMAKAGAMIWVVWIEKGERLVYPCKVLTASCSTDEAQTTVLLRFYQDNGIWDEPKPVTLYATACVGEDAIHQSSRGHLDWAPRTTVMPDESGQQNVLPQKRVRDEGPADCRSTAERLEAQFGDVFRAQSELQSQVVALKGKIEAWDVTVQRMLEYQRQHATLAEEVRKIKSAIGIDAGPSDVQVSTQATPTTSDPVCASCRQVVAYDMPMAELRSIMVGEDSKLDVADLFTSGGRVKAGSALKKLVKCDSCLEKGALKLVVCTSGGAGNRLTCDWCRCRMTVNTTDATSMWCGKKHSNCRGLVIENETDRQGNTQFLSKGLAPVGEVTPWDTVKLLDVGLEQYNDADYVIIATSSLGKALVILEIDNLSHSGGGQYTPEAERQKNDQNFASGNGFDRVLMVRINPGGKYKSTPAQAAYDNCDKKARWLVLRDWVVTFLRAPYGAWTFGDRVLLYLFYDCESPLIDRRPAFTTVVAYQAPALPTPNTPKLADWACTLDPYLIVKGSTIAQECLALDRRHPQPQRAGEGGDA